MTRTGDQRILREVTDHLISKARTAIDDVFRTGLPDGLLRPALKDLREHLERIESDLDAEKSDARP